MSFIVIGSGPAGVACARALLATGRQVVMIDGDKDGQKLRAGGLPIGPRDMAGWPVTAEELAPHSQAVLGLTPNATGATPLRAQGAALMKTMEQHEGALRKAGVRFGRCGLAGLSVDAVAGNENFTYMPGLVAHRVEESANGVRVNAVDGRGGVEAIDGDRVMVAAGVLETTRLMLRSLGVVGEYDRPVLIREAQGFVLPMLRVSGVPGFSRADEGGLAEMFVEVMDEAVSRYTIHMEAGPCDEELRGRIATGKVFPVGALRSRLYQFEGCFHSDQSPVTEGRLERNRADGGGGDVLRLTVRERPEAAVILDKLRLKFVGLRGATGMIVLARWMRLGRAAQGCNRGGSFPMMAQPVGFGSDVLGRTGGMQRVHLVDASVLPSVPSVGSGLAVMANAHRIGTAVGRG